MERKILLVVLDGLGDRPVADLKGRTPLQAARRPTLDWFASRGSNGLMDPIAPGVPAGSDTSHLALLGYDPYEAYTGRGPFEAAGVGIEVKKGDVAFRCNFATVDEGMRVVDRRAGRIREGTADLARALDGLDLDGVKALIREGTEHRAALVLRGSGLSQSVTDPDPHKVGAKVERSRALDPASEATAKALNRFVEESHRILSDHPINRERVRKGLPPANIVLPRGGGTFPRIETLDEKLHLRAACIAGVAIIKGICRVAGLDVLEVRGATGGLDTDMVAKMRAAVKALDTYDLVFMNIKACDIAGHDGKAREKVRAVEQVDEAFGYLRDHWREDTIVALTADHSTPVSTGEHSGDPVPLMVCGEGVRTDRVTHFDEVSAGEGGLGRVRGKEVLSILLDLANRSHKYGA